MVTTLRTLTRAVAPAGTATRRFICGSSGAPSIIEVWKPGIARRVKTPLLVAMSVASSSPTCTWKLRPVPFSAVTASAEAWSLTLIGAATAKVAESAINASMRDSNLLRSMFPLP